MTEKNMSPEFEAELKRLGIISENGENISQENEGISEEKSVKNDEKNSKKRPPKSTRKVSSGGEKSYGHIVRLNSDVERKIRKYHTVYCICEGKVSFSDFLLDAVESYVSKEARKDRRIDDLLASFPD